MSPKTLIDLIGYQAQSLPDKNIFVFINDSGKKELPVTFSNLELKIRAVAAELQRHGVRGQRVLLWYPPGEDYTIAFFACIFAGAIAVPSYPPTPSQLKLALSRLRPILANSRAKFILTTNQIALLGRFLPGKPAEFKGLKWLSTENVNDSMASRWEDPNLNAGSIAFLQYTSGSTGDPKGVMVTHENLLHNLGWIEKRVKLTQKDLAVIWLPPYHDLGLIGGIMQPVYSGLTCYLMSPMDFLKRPAFWMEAMSKYRATTTSGPGFAYDLCVKKITEDEKSKLDLSQWRSACIGAEPIHALTLENFFQAFGSRGFRAESFYPCYGLAEATLLATSGIAGKKPVVASLNAADLEKNRVIRVEPQKPASSLIRTFVGCGQCIPDQKILVVDPELNQLCPANQIGEFWLAGPSVTKGYWEKQLETTQTYQAELLDSVTGKKEGPYLRTGDLGFIDESGELFITGRIKDLIIIRGRNYYPHDIEASVLQSHKDLRPGGTVAFSAAFSAASSIQEADGEQLIVVSEVSKKFKTTAQTTNEVIHNITTAIKQRVLKDHGLRIKDVVLIKPGSLPKTSSGKLQRRKTSQMYRDKTLSVVLKGESISDARDRMSCEATVKQHADYKTTALTQWLLQAVSKESAMPVTEIRMDHKLGEDLGMDSLMLAVFYGELSSKFPQIKPQMMTDALTGDTTVEDLVEFLKPYDSHDEKTGEKNGEKTEIPEAYYNVALFEENKNLEERFEMIRASGSRNPYFKTHQQPSRDTLVIDGREMINYSGYNYVGMSGDPRVSAASKKAIDLYGTSASASRLASGEIPIHQELETQIARFLGVEDAIVFVAGHPTNVSTIGHVVGPKDLILHDALSHDSVIQGAKLSGAQRRPFPHNDTRALDLLLTKLRPLYRRVLIIIEGVYSMDGDIPNLPEFIRIKKNHKSLLFVDEAHSIGVLGKTGRGITEHFDIPASEVDFLMGTLSKALASCGGYIAGKRSVIEYLKYTTPGFVYSVGLSPSNTAAALEALLILQKEPERLEKLRANSDLFLKLAKLAGLDTGPSANTPIIPVIIGDSVKCLQIAEALNLQAINVAPILYPAVPEAQVRLRFFITSCHTEKQIHQTFESLPLT